MLIRLIVPEPLYVFGIKPQFLFQSLTLTYLAALTPPEFDVEIIDEGVSEIQYDKKADIIGISFTSASHSRAYKIADNYRELGIPVILGGSHTSFFPEEALNHADAIVVGEAEHVWKELLSDFKNGKLKRVYKSDKLSDLKKLPVPRYDFYDPADYFNIVPAFTSRGCPYRCSYCSYWKFAGLKCRTRPIEDVVNQIQYIKKEYVKKGSLPPLTIDFNDDNIWGDVKYAKELFRSLIPLEISWISQASVTIEEELFELAARSGCQLIFVGFESLDQRNINYINKKQNKRELYEEQIEKMHKANLAVGAFFMVGLPYDDQHCFDTMEDFLERNSVEVAGIQIFRPMIGTDIFNEKDWNGKSECKDWDSTLKAIPVFVPQNMTKKQFKHAYVKFSRRIYSDESIDKRLKNSEKPGPYFMNKGFQEFYNDPKMDEWAEE